MNISSLQLTHEEIRTAVKNYLKSRGLDINVKNVDSRGYPTKYWEVTAEPLPEVEELVPAPDPIITTVEQLGRAIEDGTV